MRVSERLTACTYGMLKLGNVDQRNACRQTTPPRVARRPLRHTSPTRELCQVNMETAERLKKVASTFSDEEEAGEEHETQRRCGLGFKEAALVRHVACLTHAKTTLTKLTTSAE